MTKRILIAEDDSAIAELERDYLEIYGYETVVADNGERAAELALSGNFSLILLDIMLPKKNGYEVCREIRKNLDIPVLMVTAKQESVDKIRGLGLGADDYISKPFDPAELVARVNAHMARYERLTGKGATKDEKECIESGSLKIYPQSWKVYSDGKEVEMANKEFELLVFLASNPNIVFSKEQLFERVWGYDYIGDSATVTVHINRIRDKIEADPKKPVIISTIRGAGYRFNLRRSEDIGQN